MPPQQEDPLTKPSLLRRLLIPTVEQRKRMLRIEAWCLLLLSYLLIAFAYLWPQDYRNDGPAYVAASWVAFMIRTFIFYLGCVLACLTIAAIYNRSRRISLAALPPILVCIGPTAISYIPSSHAENPTQKLHVMTVNLLMVNENTQPLIDEIKAADPDLLLLQEYTNNWHLAITRQLATDYPHNQSVPREDSFGLAIYSKLPFTSKVNTPLPLGQDAVPQIHALIPFAGTEVSIYNIHLLPPWELEYTIETRHQFADLLDILEKDNRPIILAGDFNFTERSPQAAHLASAGLADTLSSAGFATKSTWPVHSFFRYIPHIRLDHIYISQDLACTHCTTGVGQGSDHRPVIATLTLTSTPPKDR